jgi:asparagine synthetase B (glutamine-hydrolysing)
MRRGALGPKHLMRKILYKYVPRDIIERPKQGFAVPLSSWLRGDLKTLIDEYLSPARIRDGGLFDPGEVARAVRNFPRGRDRQRSPRHPEDLVPAVVRDVAQPLDDGRDPHGRSATCACCSLLATWASTGPRSRWWR